MSRFTTHGATRPWEVAKGYRHHTRQDLPLERMVEPPMRFGLIVFPPLFVALFIATVEVLK